MNKEYRDQSLLQNIMKKLKTNIQADIILYVIVSMTIALPYELLTLQQTNYHDVS